MAQKINEYRATYGNSDDDNQYPFVYDYNLEKAAMQRAAELVVLFDSNHMRPDGKNFLKTLAENGVDVKASNNMFAENILYGSDDTMGLNDAFPAFTADSKMRINLLGYYNAVGVAHVKVGKDDFWVQVFALIGNNNTYCDPVNGEQIVALNVPDSLIGAIPEEARVQ